MTLVFVSFDMFINDSLTLLKLDFKIVSGDRTNSKNKFLLLNELFCSVRFRSCLQLLYDYLCATVILNCCFHNIQAHHICTYNFLSLSILSIKLVFQEIFRFLFFIHVLQYLNATTRTFTVLKYLLL